jgi:hypothetical protein
LLLITSGSTYFKNKDTDSKLIKSVESGDTMNITLKIKLKYSEVILYKTILKPVTLRGPEVRLLTENKRRWAEVAEMRFLSSTAGSTLPGKKDK